MNRISIATICFNNLAELQETIRSVDMQEELPWEHWIIDGSTKPDIRNWLESSPQPAYRKWINERDKGIADAFNKGIQKTTGDIIYLLNSGDTLYDSTVIGRVKKVFETDKTVMWCNGKLKTKRGGQWVVLGRPFSKEKLYRGMSGVYHPAMFLRRELYEKHGGYDENIKMAMDYDMLCRIADEKSAFIDHPIALFDATGITSTRYLDAMDESFACYRKYFGASMKQKLWRLRLKLSHNLINTAAGKFLYKMKVKLGLENS